MNTILFSTMLCLISCNLLSESISKTTAPKKVVSGDTWVTVFVHGSFSLKPHLTLGNAINVIFDRIENSVYYRSTEINRRDHFFYKNQVMLGLGLHAIDFEHPNKLQAGRIIAATYEKISQYVGNEPSKEYYAFGWSGLVSHKLRYLEAGILYTDLFKVCQTIKKTGKNPKVRIISYSHGGNLSIQLGAVHVTKNPSEQITIDELYLAGTPVQIETDYLINSPIFKKVYNLYSKADSIQKLDFFSFKRFFSCRKFSNRRNFQLPDKLTQIRLCITDYTPKKAGTAIPKDCSDAFLRKNFTKCSYDPGHFELWFMGWTILSYRKNFPLNPLPIIDFLPIMVKNIESCSQASGDLIIQILPYKNSMEIYNYERFKYHNEPISQMPFIDKKFLDDLKTTALQYEPVDYNLETYNRKMYDAISIAQFEYDQLNKLKIQEFKNIKNEKLAKKAASKERKVVNLQKKDPKIKGFLHKKNMSMQD